MRHTAWTSAPIMQAFIPSREVRVSQTSARFAGITREAFTLAVMFTAPILPETPRMRI